LRPHIGSGRAIALAVTSAQRSPALPDVPTVAESGLPGYVVDQWYGVATLASVPPAVVEKLNAGIVEAIKSPDVAQRMAADGSTPVGSTSAEFRKHVRAEVDKWRKVLQETGIVLTGAK
jgi:tripartite-type tricarboxylate transporter receptor subunit TctC